MSRAVVLTGGEVHEGTGRPPRKTDVLLNDDRIAEIGAVDRPSDAEVIDVTGLIVSPGFIDVHSHSDYTLLIDPRAMSSIMQGVTTEIVGNCGHGCSPYRNKELGRIAVYGPIDGNPTPPDTMAGYFDALGAARPAVNVLTLVPNGQLRLEAVGLEHRPATDGELSTMMDVLREGMQDGALGVSTGLEYAQENGASEEEITALAGVASSFGGIYATHTRDRDSNAVAAVEEAIRIAARAEVRLQVSHITPRGGMDDLEACLDVVTEARNLGQPVDFDMHTRLFGFTHLKNLVPLKDVVGGRDEMVRKFADSGERERMKQARNLITRCGWHKVTLARSRHFADFVGMSFEAIGSELSIDPHDAALDVLIADVDEITYPMVTLQTYTEEQLRRTYMAHRCMLGSDATVLAPDGPLAEEIFYGAYSWVSWFWQRMVRETGTFSYPEAIHRLTGLPADVFGISQRGTLKPGNFADVVAFDPDTFTCNATVKDPNLLASGVRELFVNGVHTIAGGKLTKLRGGVGLRRSG